MKTTRPYLSASLLVALCASTALCACDPRSQAMPESSAAAPLIHVESAPVTAVEAPVELHLTGTLKGWKEAELAANAAGRVVRTYVERGDQVKEGQIVAQLDTRAAALSLAQASVEVESSQTQDGINRAECARYEQLRLRGALSALEFDQATAKCKIAPLSVEVARWRQSIAAKNVGDGTIRAPFAGTISERFVQVGEYVQASSRVVALVQGGQLRLEFTVPEANLAQVKTGADVSFSVAAYPDKVFHGTVRYVAGAVRPTTRDLVVEALINNDDQSLRAGMFASIALRVGTERLPTVPLAAVFERQDKKRVYVVAGGRLEEHVLQAGPELQGRLTVQSGVKVGDQVAVGDLSALHNGARVN